MQMAENGFSSCSTASNAASDSFEFEWEVEKCPWNLASQEFSSKLSGGIKFQIIVHRCDSRSHQNPQFKVKLVMIENAKNCEIKTFLFFEIRNSSGQLCLKDSIEKTFTHLNEEHESDGFEIKPVGQQRNIQCEVANASHYRQDRSDYNTEIHVDRKFVIQGSIIFQCCEEEIVPENITQLQSDFKGLLHNKFYADIKFRIGNDVMHAHKTILCSRSVVFRKMFEQNMKEKEGSTVKITDIEKSVFEAFLHFLYTGTILDNSLDIVMPLYSVADKYAVDTLLTTCGKILVSYLSDKNVVIILKLADMHNDATLKTTTIDFICKNFAKVEVTDSWDALLNSDPRLASYALKQVSDRAAKERVIAENVLVKNPFSLDHEWSSIHFFGESDGW